MQRTEFRAPGRCERQARPSRIRLASAAAAPPAPPQQRLAGERHAAWRRAGGVAGGGRLRRAVHQDRGGVQRWQLHHSGGLHLLSGTADPRLAASWLSGRCTARLDRWPAAGRLQCCLRILLPFFSPVYRPTHPPAEQGKDSGGGDLLVSPGRPAGELGRMCADEPACVGFSTGGGLKSEVRPGDYLEPWAAGEPGPCDGIYLLDRATKGGWRQRVGGRRDGREVGGQVGDWADGWTAGCPHAQQACGGVAAAHGQSARPPAAARRRATAALLPCHPPTHPPADAACPDPPANYTFTAGSTSDGPELLAVGEGATAADLAKQCDANPDCAGFVLTTGGGGSLRAAGEGLSDLEGAAPCDGFYEKAAAGEARGAGPGRPGAGLASGPGARAQPRVAPHASLAGRPLHSTLFTPPTTQPAYPAAQPRPGTSSSRARRPPPTSLSACSRTALAPLWAKPSRWRKRRRPARRTPPARRCACARAPPSCWATLNAPLPWMMRGPATASTGGTPSLRRRRRVRGGCAFCAGGREGGLLGLRWGCWRGLPAPRSTAARTPFT